MPSIPAQLDVGVTVTAPGRTTEHRLNSGIGLWMGDRGVRGPVAMATPVLGSPSHAGGSLSPTVDLATCRRNLPFSRFVKLDPAAVSGRGARGGGGRQPAFLHPGFEAPERCEV